jgi:hypothetical protein
MKNQCENILIFQLSYDRLWVFFTFIVEFDEDQDKSFDFRENRLELQLL